MMGQIEEFCVNAPPNCKTHVFLLKIQLSLQKGTDTHVQLHQPKKWLEEAEAQVSKIKSKGLDLFLTEYLRIIFKGWPTEKKSHLQANHPLIGHDGTNSRILCQRAPKLQNTCFFAETTVVLAKGCRPHMFSFTNQKKVTWRGRGAGVKNKIQGAGPFFWPNSCGWSSKAGPTGKKSHHQANHPLIGHDGTNWRILCQRAPKLQNTWFFPEDTFVHAKGLRIAVGICRTALVKPWTLKNCELSAGKSGARNSFFFRIRLRGGKIRHVTNASIQEIFFLPGYQRGNFIVCWTLGTRKLAKKIQKGGWKWDFGFRG